MQKLIVSIKTWYGMLSEQSKNVLIGMIDISQTPEINQIFVQNRIPT